MRWGFGVELSLFFQCIWNHAKGAGGGGGRGGGFYSIGEIQSIYMYTYICTYMCPYGWCVSLCADGCFWRSGHHSFHGRLLRSPLMCRHPQFFFASAPTLASISSAFNEILYIYIFSYMCKAISAQQSSHFCSTVQIKTQHERGRVSNDTHRDSARSPKTKYAARSEKNV